MFADRWFGKRYFGNRYFGPAGASTADTLLYRGDPGYYRRPIKYVRDGQIVDLNEPERVTLDEIVYPALTLAMVAALNALLPGQPSPLPGMLASLEGKFGQVLIERELAAMADDDAALVLLMS